MKSTPFLIFLPLMAAACAQWDLGGGKLFYVAPSYTMLQVTVGDNLERLYQLSNVDIKPLACMAMTLNTTLKIDGVPEFSRQEVSRLCHIPTSALSNRNLKSTKFPKLRAELYPQMYEHVYN